MINQTKGIKLVKICSIIFDSFDKYLKYACDCLLDWLPNLGSYIDSSNTEYFQN